jgi:hypothetical protein
MLMLSRKVDRLERWVMELTDKLSAHLKAYPLSAKGWAFPRINLEGYQQLRIF